jgi:Tfp pilus assembly protein PilF
MEIDDISRAMSYLGHIDDATLTDPDGLLNTALNLLNRKRPAEATKVLNRVVTRFPDAPDAYFYRAHASLTTDQVASAKADLEKYLSIAPPTAPMLAQAKDLLAKIK